MTESNLDRKIITYQISIIAIIAILLISYFSGLYGFVSPDSWNYLRLSSSLISTGKCHVYDEYFAVFPCGYPLIVSAISYAGGIEDLLISSKLANLILMLLTFLFAYKSSKKIIVAFIIVCNPLTLSIFHFTWSENLFLFSTISTMYCVIEIQGKRYTHPLGAFLLFSLILGCSSRYFFGPFALFIFLSAYFIYGFKLAKKIFPFFAAAGLFFIGYYLINYHLTGHGTGMPRIPAPESVTLLILFFLKAIARDVALTLLCAVPILYLATRIIINSKVTIHELIKVSDNSFAYFMLLVGISYLVLSFLFRVYTQFDLYVTRTIGYGTVFIFSAIVAITTSKVRIERNIVIAVAASCVLAVLFSQPRFYLYLISNTESASYVPFAKAIKSYPSGINYNGAIVSIAPPTVSALVAPNSDIYYSIRHKVLSPMIAPYWVPDTSIDFQNRIHAAGENSCNYDFTNVKNVDELNAILDGHYAVDILFDKGILRPYLEYNYQYSDDLRKMISSIFEPGKLVPCGQEEKGRSE